MGKTSRPCVADCGWSSSVGSACAVPAPHNSKLNAMLSLMQAKDDAETGADTSTPTTANARGSAHNKATTPKKTDFIL